MLEFDPKRLPPLVGTASTAILVRLQSQEADSEELRALANALRSLRAIQTRRLDRRGDRQQERRA